MPLLHFATAINAPPQTVFERIADFAHYDQWLLSSDVAKSVMAVSDSPVKMGSTYVDKGTNSTMYGEVTVFEPPNKITFHQVTHLKLLHLVPARLDITIAYQVTVNDRGTNLERDVAVQTNGLLTLVQSRLLPEIAAESQRLLAALKTGLEKAV